MKKTKQILAILLVVILVGMYIVTLFMAIFDNTATMSMFKGCVACTIFVPVVLYFYSWLHKWGMKRSGRKDYDSRTDENLSE